jgi:hypothetical protein
MVVVLIQHAVCIATWLTLADSIKREASGLLRTSRCQHHLVVGGSESMFLPQVVTSVVSSSGPSSLWEVGCHLGTHEEKVLGIQKSEEDLAAYAQV